MTVDSEGAMRTASMVLFLLAVILPGPLGAQPERAEPSPEAAAAYVHLESEDAEAQGRGCESFLTLVRGGSEDPWVYRGAARCADQLEEMRDAVNAAFAAAPADSAFALFGRGYFAYLDGDLETAADLLRQSVAREGRLALAWNALGAVLHHRGDAEAAIPLIEKALEVAPQLEMARNNLARAQLYAGVFDRLEALLREIPRRWSSLPKPRVPLLGKRPDEAYAASNEEEVRTAVRFISKLALSTLEIRERMIDAWLDTYEPSEVDVWTPGARAQEERLRSRHREAALILEAWLQFLEKLGRKDALLSSASDAVDLLVELRGIVGIEPLLRSWTELSAPSEAAFGMARITQIHGRVLSRLGENDQALGTYRYARELFQAVSDQLGQGNTWVGEADILLLLGANDQALGAYRNARRLFQAIGDQLGQGNTWLGEADVFFHLGENDQAIRAYREAREFFQAVGDQLGQGNTWEGEADVLFRLGKNDQAVGAYRRARRMFQVVGDQLGRGNTWKGEADILFRFGENNQALVAYWEARELFQAVGDQLGQGNTWVGEAEVLFRLGENDQALSAYREAREQFQAVGDRLGQGNTWVGEADVLYRFGKNHKALGAYRKARELFQAVGDQLGLGNTWKGEAAILYRSGKNDQALSALRKARELFQSVGDQQGQGNSWRGEAEVLFRLGENDQALIAFREARKLSQAAGDQQGQGNSWKGEADVLYRFGENHQALVAYREARELFQAIGDQLGQGNSWFGEADVLFRLGENDRALGAYRKSRRLFEAVGDQLGHGHTWLREAEVHFILGDKKGTLRAYRNARELYESVGDRQGQGSTWVGEAEVLLTGGKPAEAALAAHRGVELTASIAAKQNEIRARLVEIRARFQLEEMDRVVQLADRAINLFGQWRDGFITDAHRTRQEGVISPAYEFLIPALWRLDQPLAALVRAEQAHSRVLLDLVATGNAAKSLDVKVDIDSLQQREELASKLATITQELSGNPPHEKRKNLLRKRAVLDAQSERLVFESLLSADKPLVSRRPLDLAGIRFTARESGPMLLYYVAAGETYAFLLRGEKQPVGEVLELSRDDLRRRARELSDVLANPVYEHRAADLVRELWAALLGPLADHLPPHGPLTLVLHGPLHLVPFETLVNSEGEALFERFDVTVAPSISALHHVRARHRTARPDDSLLALASGEGLTLPATEVRRIAGFFDSELASDFEPTMARYAVYRSLAPRARHLVIASQGTLTAGSQRLTYLEIQPSHAHDHRLTASEIASLPIDAELVTLSACDTAAAEALLSDERLDLTRAFLVAGAASVLATRWKVPEDYRTSRFLVDFYRAYRQGGPDGRGQRKDQALTEARRRSRDRGDPAQIWAAWVLVGDGR